MKNTLNQNYIQVLKDMIIINSIIGAFLITFLVTNQYMYQLIIYIVLSVIIIFIAFHSQIKELYFIIRSLKYNNK